ncbi:MAG: hypothetical protein Q4B93_05430, partial [Clostridia bacterium]|nr:hypothetical protein [Clostridia bacterium]
MSEITLANKEKLETVAVPNYSNVVSGYQNALKIVDDVVLKNYITQLSNLDIVPLDNKVLESNLDENVLLFKINEMVYEKDEFALYKFSSVYNTLASSDTTMFIMINSDGEKTDFY